MHLFRWVGSPSYASPIDFSHSVIEQRRDPLTSLHSVLPESSVSSQVARNGENCFRFDTSVAVTEGEIAEGILEGTPRRPIILGFRH